MDEGGRPGTDHNSNQGQSFVGGFHWTRTPSSDEVNPRSQNVVKSKDEQQGDFKNQEVRTGPKTSEHKKVGTIRVEGLMSDGT